MAPRTPTPAHHAAASALQIQGEPSHEARRRFLRRYLGSQNVAPLFLCGDAVDVLRGFPDACCDLCLTSPPYWTKRAYAAGGLGLEAGPTEYVDAIVRVMVEVHRVLKTTGSLWLNIGDSYRNKGLANIPWRVALRLTDDLGFIQRNTVIWHKVKGGPDNARDKLRNVYEPIFHFVKDPRHCYYNVDAIRNAPAKARVQGGAVVSATGVTGVRYRRQIELSTALLESEKEQALAALDATLNRVRRGELADFRFVIRGQQRVTHSDAEQLSGRAKELRQRGFYVLHYHPNGSKPSDVWDIIPEDSQGRSRHFAAFPLDVCRIPIAATCPPGGVVLDPFCGTGTTNLVAASFGRKSIGIDMAADYIALAKERLSRSSKT